MFGWVKILLQKHEGISYDPQNAHKAEHSGIHLYPQNSYEEVESGDVRILRRSQAS